MSDFTGPLDVRRVGSSHAVILRDLTFYYDVRGRWGHAERHLFTVPRGFRTDGASIPWPLRFLAGHPFGTAIRSAVLHDWLYSQHLCTRGQSDRIMFVSMGVEGVSMFRRCIIWAALRVGGWWAWRTSPKIPDRIVTADVLDAGGPRA